MRCIEQGQKRPQLQSKRRKKIKGEVREREKEERGKDRQRRGKNNRSKERGGKIEKGEVVHRKEGKGEAERDRGREKGIHEN